MPQFSESFETVGFTSKAYQFGLSSATPLSQLIPGQNQQTYRVQFSFPYDSKVWVGLNVSPSLPVEGTAASSPNVALNPKFKFVRAGDTLYFNSTAAVTDCGFELLSLGG